MEYFARKIQRAKWGVLPYMGANDIGADAITGPCLRTQNNKLSVWKCDSGREAAAEVALALLVNMDHIETIDVVLLHKDALERNSFILKCTEGDTAVESLRHRHFDIEKLTATKITDLAEIIAINVRGEVDCYRFTMSEVREILISSVQVEKIKLEDLKVRVREKVEKYL